jgi:hypothetical protein
MIAKRRESNCPLGKSDNARIFPIKATNVGSALTKVTVNGWSLQPYHLIRQAAVLTDPLADIRRVGAPQLLRVEGGGGPADDQQRLAAELVSRCVRSPTVPRQTPLPRCRAPREASERAPAQKPILEPTVEPC